MSELIGRSEGVRVCPECGSPLVDFSALSGGLATCRACKWAGSKDDLYSVPLTDQGSSEELLLSIRNDFRAAFATTSQPIIKVLVKWGFVQAVARGNTVEVVNQKEVVRYINRMAQGAFVALFEVRQEIEKERISGNGG